LIAKRELVRNLYNGDRNIVDFEVWQEVLENLDDKIEYYDCNAKNHFTDNLLNRMFGMPGIIIPKFNCNRLFAVKPYYTLLKYFFNTNKKMLSKFQKLEQYSYSEKRNIIR